MAAIIPIGGGKGGVGKTVCAANLGVALAELGKTTVLVDADFGGSNLHTWLGIKNRHPGLGAFVHDRSLRLEDLVVPTAVDRLFLVPGDALLTGTANLPFFRKLRLIKELGALPADLVLLDLGAGSAHNTVDLFLLSNAGIVITTSELTAILNAYAFVKAALFRLVWRSFPAKSAARAVIERFAAQRLEGTDTNFAVVFEQLAAVDAAWAEDARRQTAGFVPRVILNNGRGSDDVRMGAKLRKIVAKNLTLDVEYIGYLPYDEGVPRSLLARTPFVLSFPDSRFARNLAAIARTLVDSPAPATPPLFDAHEDLAALVALAEAADD